MKGVEALFAVGTIIGDSHRRKSPTHHDQYLNLRRMVQALLNEVVQ